MENIDITSSKAIYLKIDLDIRDKKTLASLKENLFHLGFETENTRNFDVKLTELQNQSYEAQYTYKEISHKLIITHDNIRNSLKLLSNLLKQESNLKKGHIKKTIPNNVKVESSNEYKVFSLLEKNQNIDSFLNSLFSVAPFKSYSTIHLFMHEKGSKTAKQITIEKGHKSESEHDLVTFTTLFNAIKKSKNRSFGQSSLKASNFHIIGTCIAHELVLSTHNVIFILTNNDFLAQENKYIDEFNQIIGVLKLCLEFSLQKQSLNKSNQLIYNIFELFEHKLNQNFDLKKNLDLVLENFINVNKENINFHQEKLTLLGELLNTLRHELSNPLFGLQLSTELLKTEELQADQIELIDEISKAITRSQDIIENFSNLYQSKTEFEKVNIESLLKEVFTLTKSESKGINFQINKTADKSYNVIGNKTWLAQIFFNLIVNSSQAIKNNNTDNPKITIFLDESDNEILITFTDNGPGILNSGVDIFTPFYTTKLEGTGLGLNICRNLVQKMNGTIQLEESKIGAKFKIRLPNENTHR